MIIYIYELTVASTWLKNKSFFLIKVTYKYDNSKNSMKK